MTVFIPWLHILRDSTQSCLLQANKPQYFQCFVDFFLSGVHGDMEFGHTIT
nr:hypothetical protein [Aeromonas veronii]